MNDETIRNQIDIKLFLKEANSRLNGLFTLFKDDTVFIHFKANTYRELQSGLNIDSIIPININNVDKILCDYTYNIYGTIKNITYIIFFMYDGVMKKKRYSQGWV